MPKADAAWDKHTTAAQKEVEKDSGITVKVNGWECKYCDGQFWNKNLDRLRRHLTGDQQQCKGCRITPCTDAPEDVRKEMTATLAGRQALADSAAKRKATSEEIADEFGKNRANQIQQRMVAKRKSVSDLEVDGALSDMFDGLGIAHNKIDHPLFRRGVQKLRNAHPDYKLPHRKSLGGSILEHQYQCDVDDRTRHLQHKLIKKFGKALLTDGATIQKTPLLNTILMCPVWRDALFLSCEDCTDHLASGLSKDAEYIADVVIKGIRRLPFPRFVDLIITDGAGDMRKFHRLVTAVFPWIDTQWCISHLSNCILKKSAEGHSKLQEHIDKAKKIVDRFTHHHSEHAMFRQMSKAMSRDLALIRYCEPRFGLYFLMLHRLQVLKRTLKAVIHSGAYRAMEYEDDEEAVIIDDSAFWDYNELVVKATWPLLQLVRLGDERKTPTLHRVYKYAKLTKRRLAEAKDDDLSAHVLEAFEHYERHLCSDIVKAASIVDVGTWARGNLEDVNECKEKLSDYITKFAEQYEEPDGFVEKAEEQMLSYLNNEGVYATEAVLGKARTMAAYRFWDKYSGSSPEFSKVALHLSSKVCGSGEAERNWKDYKFVYDKARNRTSSKKQQMLITRYNALRLRAGIVDPGDIDPREEVLLYGCEEELVDPAAAPEPLVAGGANERVRENPFNAWPESWEDQAIFEPEVSGATGRYQLKTKFVGMHLYDPDDGVEEHRIIVELEWNKTKPRGWKTNTPQDWKQWKAVTELDPKHHQDKIDKEGHEDTLESYWFNDDLYDMILAAPREEQPRTILTGDEDSDDVVDES